LLEDEGLVTCVFSHERLHVEDCPSREQWLENIFPLLGLGVGEEAEGGMVFPKRLIQYPFFVPAG
jgi:hypothetical protein